jgi:large subunit ribosomal protein L4
MSKVRKRAVSRLPTLFGREYNEALIHQVLVAYQANGRSGNRGQKDRQDVRHTTKKPWRQKGYGPRSRWHVVFADLARWWPGFPSSPDENFSHKLNRKMYRAGMASILSQLVREDRLAVVDSLTIEAPKTKLVCAKIKGMGYDSVLVITDALDENVFLASRNLPNVLVVEVQQADPVSLVRFPKVLLTKGALAKFEEILG